MSDENFRQMIEAGNLQGLKGALASCPELANQSVVWSLNQKNESDPLHYVCDCVFNNWLDDARAAEIVALLIENGALIEGTEGRESPLIAATSLGTETVAKLLIDSGANLEATAVFGARPLHWAALMGLTSTVELLIQCGAELEVKCMEFGATPLYWAVFGFGPHGPNKKTDTVGSAKVLLDAGASVDTTNNQGISAIKCSQQADSNEMYELLIRYANES
ncbi:ankyrin repeat domain-containing protein [Marinicella sediminis]|uniref:Ankyrin repeat domain-containing protein n=1 Tax=Marinicella sediminis TaxID=1792834 RepID=A0ABV7J9S5_9GAMM|nr:ankyrin repeat domain-containing protein [Marinicella sediminis]